LNGNPHSIHFFKDEPQCLDGAFQDRRKRKIECVSFIVEQTPRRASFFDTEARKRNVSPACETVFLIPRALAMAQQHERLHIAEVTT
jgi:hypothetical protein